jgi:hypothetical protein
VRNEGISQPRLRSGGFLEVVVKEPDGAIGSNVDLGISRRAQQTGPLRRELLGVVDVIQIDACAGHSRSRVAVACLAEDLSALGVVVKVIFSGGS